ncbi:Outer membrane protein assembly factor YaeT precursor [Vulgatibacter incomptus]|uniref:Outer membrane protein assembly factor YaeT n=2 Tax=Vulgatibacter incomptus TaxID=1391653 RepID=A0A0K1PA03_9BACT|nr:Outer membrane protein assembly factor YaeT precursor [Vulgatibacter incomptus]
MAVLAAWSPLAALASELAGAPDEPGAVAAVAAVAVPLGEEPPSDAPIVREVEIRGVEDPSDLEPLLTVEAGDPLSRRALRRSLQRLFETGRFGNVTAFTTEVSASEVRLVIILEPKRSISSILLLGVTRADPDALRRASTLTVGIEHSEDRLETAAAGIRAALAKAGFERAQVRARAIPSGEGVEVRLNVDEGNPTKLVRLKLVGEPGDAALWQSAITLEAGQILDRARLDAELDALRARYRQAGYYRARVGQPRIVPQGDELAEVEVEVAAGPKIELLIRGNHAWDSNRLRGYLAYDGDTFLDDAMVSELAGRLERVYRRAGYFDVRVTPTERASADRRTARLTFHVREGRPLLVSDLVFKGNKAYPDEALRSLVEETLAASLESKGLLTPLERGELDRATGTVRHGTGSGVEPLLVYDDELYAQVIDELLAKYRDDGFLDVQIDKPAVSIEEARRLARVEVRIREGKRTRIREVDYPGAAAVDAAALVPSNAVAIGHPVSERELQAHRVAVRAAYGKLGYLYASVETELVRPPEDPTAARVLFYVREGPQVRVGRILVQGNARTSRVVFDDALELREGEVLGSDQIVRSQQQLMRLGLFRTVTVRPLDPEVAETVKDMVVEVRERPSKALEVGGGLSIADGPRAFAEYTQRNVFGRNLLLSLRGRVNYQVFRDEVLEMPADQGIERFVDLGLGYPRIYGLPFELGARLDLIHERDIRPAYGVTRYAVVSGLDWPFSRRAKASLLYEVESNWIERSPQIDDLYTSLSRADLQRLRFPNGNTLLGSVRPGLVFNLQDDPVSPRSGVFAKVEADFARNLGGDTTVDFAKVWGTFTGYIPIAGRTSLALSASGGRVFPLQSSSTTIAPKRFYLGGASTIRGFAEDAVVPEDLRAALRKEIADCQALAFSAGCSQAARFLQEGRDVPSTGGELFVLGRAELRFPIQGNLMGGLFVDAGNLWSDPALADLARLRSAVGAGLRYATPVGPVALDLGINLDPDPVLSEAPFALHFSIGLF